MQRARDPLSACAGFLGKLGSWLTGAPGNGVTVQGAGLARWTSREGFLSLRSGLALRSWLSGPLP